MTNVKTEERKIMTRKKGLEFPHLQCCCCSPRCLRRPASTSPAAAHVKHMNNTLMRSQAVHNRELFTMKTHSRKIVDFKKASKPESRHMETMN